MEAELVYTSKNELKRQNQTTYIIGQIRQCRYDETERRMNVDILSNSSGTTYYLWYPCESKERFARLTKQLDTYRYWDITYKIYTSEISKFTAFANRLCCNIQ